MVHFSKSLKKESSVWTGGTTPARSEHGQFGSNIPSIITQFSANDSPSRATVLSVARVVLKLFELIYLESLLHFSAQNARVELFSTEM